MNSRIPFTSAAAYSREDEATAGRKSALLILCAIVFAFAAMVALPSAANAAIGISNFNYTNSTLQANGHPATTISFNRTGSESDDLKDIQLDLPTGVFANPEAATVKCTASQFAADACPAQAQVGSVQVKVKALSLLDLTIDGSVDVLQAEANQVATLGLSLRPKAICILFVFCAQPNKIYLRTGIVVKTYEDSGLRTYTPGSPRSSVIGIPLLFVTPTITGDITINSLSLSFQPKGGTTQTSTSPYFWRQTGSCLPATSNVNLVSYSGQTAAASKTYTPTGCGSVLNNTTFGFNPSIKTAQTPSPVTFTLAVPEADKAIQDSLPKIVDNDFPNGSGISTEALTGVTGCTEDQLKTSACPASSIIGNASAASKYLPAGLSGNVYAMGVGAVGNEVPIAVQVKAPTTLGIGQATVIFRGTLGVRGDTASGTGRAYARFDRIPQLPFSGFTLNLTKALYVNPPTCGPATTTANITGFNGTAATSGNGTVVTRTASYTPTGCSPAPDTTITNGPGTTTVDNTPTFTFSSSIAGSTFQCKQDAGAYQPCTSPFTSAEQSNGAHSFSVYAVNGITADPSPAVYNYTVNVSNVFTITPSITPSTSQAAGHPDLATTFDVSGGQPKTLQIKLPAGFNASLNAVAKCATADALAGNCPANSKIGSGQVTVNAFAASQTGVGDIFLTDGPTADDAGGVAVKFELPLGTFIAQAGAYLVNNGSNQYLNIRSFPNNINGNDFTISQLKLNFSGANDFLTNPSKCSTDQFTSSGTAYDGSAAPAINVNYTTTGCATVGFAPTVNQVFSSTAASTTSAVVATVTLPSGNGSIQNLTVVEPPAFGPNYPAFGRAQDMCPSASATLSTVFDPTNCPSQSIVGSMVINTPLLPTPLTGTVYLINKTPLPWFGVKFDQPGISVRLTGITDLVKVDPACDEATDPNGFCQKQISVRFNNVPDVPVSTVVFSLNSGPRTRPAPLAPLDGNILTVADSGDTSCQPTSPAKASADSWLGKSATSVQNITFTGC